MTALFFACRAKTGKKFLHLCMQYDKMGIMQDHVLSAMRKENCNMKQKNYPLYETTVFENFRVLTENAAKKFPDKAAVVYKKNPKDT